MNTFLRMEGRVVQWLSEDYQRRVLRAAVRQAHVTFTEWHPNWAENLFDEQFVMTGIYPVLESAIREGISVTPYQMALLWSQQVGHLPDRQIHHSAAILAASRQFLALVADAMADHSDLEMVGERATLLSKAQQHVPPMGDLAEPSFAQPVS